MLQRLKALRDQQEAEVSQDPFARPFAGIGKDKRKLSDSESDREAEKHTLENGQKSPPAKRPRHNSSDGENKNLSPVSKMILSPSKFGPAISQREISGELY